MRKGGMALAVALVVVLSGCAFVSDTMLTDADGTATGGEPTAVSGSESSDQEHPWADGTVIVAVDDQTPDRRPLTPLVREAVATWNGTSVTGGTVHFRVLPDAANPDVRITVPLQIKGCDGQTARNSFIYCAPRVGPGTAHESPVDVQIAGQNANATFRNIAIGTLALLVNQDPESTTGYPSNRDTIRYSNPWPLLNPVVINVTNEANTSRDVVPLVEETVVWWSDRHPHEKNYTVNFVVRPDARNADLEVKLVDEISTCGLEHHDQFLGCADRLNQSTLAKSPRQC